MTRSDILLAALAASIALGAGASIAQDRHGRDPGAMFERLDADGDGQVTTAELDAARDGRWDELDADGDGQVSRMEFVARAEARAKDRAEQMFERLDADGDGILTRDAIEAQRGRGDRGIRMLSRLDADGDGAVTREEFDAGMERFAERRGRGRGDGFHRRN